MAKRVDRLGDRPGALRRGLMLYGSTAAMAAALMLAEGGLDPAHAQEIGPRVVPTEAAQGTFTVPGQPPAPFFEHRSATLDIVNMNRDAVLNWTTYDSAAPGGAQGNSYVNFLPVGAELRFVGNGESFTAINRVFTTPNNASAYRGIAIQGQVTSYLFGDGPGFVGPVGGNIWFYSPGGILATGTASFNVGSLLLSASDLENFNDQGFGRSVDFTGVADPFAAVILKTGVRVTLTQPNSSFGIVAPTIEQGGDVTVNGSVLYLSGEEGFLFFGTDGSLFGSANVEARAGNEIRHLGTTTGPASLATDDFTVFDPQTIEFRSGRDVRVLLSGTIGYAPADSAVLRPNGSIVLTAGAVSSTRDLELTSNTSIEADSVDLQAGAGDLIRMGGDANGAYALAVDSPDGRLSAGAGGVIDIDGDVSFVSRLVPGDLELSAAGRNANSPGGRIEVGGNLTLDASVGRFNEGSQQGGSVEGMIGDGGSIVVGGNLSLIADAYATADNDGITSARGGQAALAMTGSGASLSVGESLTLSAQARPFLQNCECFPPGGGFAIGGNASLTSTGGTIDAGSLNVSANAEAYASFYVAPGAPLDATGGNAVVALGDSTANFSAISVSADARGARSRGDTDGGAALGGTASFSKGAGGSLAAGGLVVSAEATGGAGSPSDGESFPASRGGDAEGGLASIVLGQNAAGLVYLDLSASARAGNGGSGAGYSAESGGDGGDATGGTATLVLSGAGNNLAGVLEGSLNVSANGGNGGRGEADFDNAIRGGDGGAGGTARGGTLAITAADGAEFAWDMSYGLGTFGGSGGRGGDQTFGEGGASGIGAGGRGGDAIGATVSITADGGSIAGDLYLDARGQGGSGGLNGLDLDESFTGNAEFGESRGGSIALTARDNGTSRFDVGSAVLLASGEIAGLITVADESTAVGAGMRFADLAAEAEGTPAGAAPAFRLSAVRNAIEVEGTAEVDAQSIALDFAGSGRFEVGGFTFLASDGGDIAITHADNPGVLSLHSIGPVEIYADSNYDAGVGSVVASGDYALIRALGSIAANDTRSLTSVTMTAEGDVTVGSVAASDDVQLYAGRLEFDGGYGYQPGARATVTGTVTAGGSVLVEAGGFAEFAGGSRVLSDNDIVVRTGDDIVVASGASLVSDIDPDADLSMHLLAGDINFGPFSGDLIEPIATPIASLRIAGSLDTNGASLFLSGDAIDATGSAITTRNLYVDVTDAPPFGPFSNDGGLLGVDCRQGSACLGAVTADGDVAIGLASNNGLVSLRTGAIDFTGDHFDVATLDRLDLNPGNVLSNLTATQRISLRSDNDVMALAGITLNAPVVRLSAGTDLAAGTATLISANVIEIDVGNDISVGTIIAGGLDDGSESSTFGAPGDFLVGSLTYGGATDMRISAAGDLSLGFADPRGRAIDLEAAGALFLGSTAAASGAIRLEGAAVSFDNLRSSGLVDIIAGDGGISGFSQVARVIDTTGGIGLETSGDIEVGDLFAGTDMVLSAATVSAVRLSAGDNLAIQADGLASVGTFSAGGDAYFTAAALDLGGGSVGGELGADASGGDLAFTDLSAGGDAYLLASGAIAGGDIAAGGLLFLVGGSLSLGNAAGAGGVTAVSDGDTSFASLASSGGSVGLSGGALVSGGTITAAADAGVTGGAVTLDSVITGTGLTLSAASLDAGTLSAGSDLMVDVSGDASIALADAGGALDLAVDGAAVVGSASAGAALTLHARSLDAGTLTAGTDLDLSVDGLAEIGSMTAAGEVLMRARELMADTLTAGAALDITVENAATIGTARASQGLTLRAASLDAGALHGSAGLDVVTSGAAAIDGFTSSAGGTIEGATLDLGSGEIVGAFAARSLSGDLRFADLGVVGGANLTAAHALIGGDALATGTLSLTGASIAIGTGSGNAGVTATTPGSASFAALASSGGDVALDAGGAVEGGSAGAAGSVTIAGSSVGLDNASFGAGLTITARSGALTGSGLYQGTGAVSLQAAQGVAIGSVDALGGIAMTAGAEARFVELRSRDGSVVVNAGAGITGSSVAATGSDAAGDDSVSLVATGPITLDGAVGVLNSASRAQDDFTARAGGAVTIVRAEGGRDLAITAGAGTLSGADAVSGRDLSLTGPAVQFAGGRVARNLTVRATGGNITGSGTTTVGGAVDLGASGSIEIGALAANGGGLALASGTGGGISAGNLSATGNLSVDAGSQGFAGAGLTATGGIALASTGGVAFGAVNAGSSADIDAGGAIAGGTVAAGGATSVDANGAIALTGLTAGGASVRSANGAVSATGVAVGGLLTARGTAVTLAAPGSLQVNAQASAGNLAIAAGGTLTVDGTATGDVALASSGGSVIIGNVGQSEGGGGIGGESVSGGGAVAVTAANAISVADSLTAGGALSMTAGGLVSLDGSATGQTIALRAADLAIGSAGSLGSAMTQRISLSSSAPINLGTGASGGFAVDAAEFARIQTGGDLMVSALAGTGPGSGSLTVGALTVNAGSGGQIGSSGTFGLTAAGLLDVSNTLSIARAGSGNTLMLTGDAVDLDYANAALSVLDSANASTGRIVVNGRLITSLSAAAAADIVGKTPAEIDLRLGQADATRETGLFRTGSLTLEGRDAILIQNSGGPAADARRGLNVGALTVTGAANGNTLVVINGIVNNATGNNAAQIVTVTNPIAGGSTVNGCVLANIAACFVVIEPVPLIVAPESVLFGTSDFIKDEEEDDELEEGVADGKTEAPPIDTTRIDDPAGLPMIDDPVTGAGNEDLWQPPDE